MKKIIYSLVIMIAAGNLFTSCIQQLEPTGIQEMREAKAEYYEALAGLKNADAAKVLAEAEVEKAKAAVVNAKAAQEQAKATILELKAEAAAMANEQKAAEVAAAIDSIEAAAALAAVEAEEDLAKAEAQLAKTLDNLAVQAEQLTWAEQLAVSAYVTAYNQYLEAQKQVYEKEKDLYSATYNEYGVDNVEAAKARYELAIAAATVNAARAQALYDEYEEMSEEEIAKYDVWAAEYEMLQDSIYAYEYEKAELKKAAEVAKVQNKEAFDNFFQELTDAQTKVEKAVNASKTGFSMVYTRAKENAFELPDATASVVTTFQKEVRKIDNDRRISVDDAVIGGTTNGRVLSIDITGEPEVAENFIFGDEKHPENVSLAGIIDALKRDSVVVDKIINDTTGLGAAVAAVKAEYKAVKDTLVKGIADYKPYKDSLEIAAAANKAYEDAKGDFKKDTGALLTSINNFVAVWNKHTNEKLDLNDSTEIWNAFMALMSAREKALDYNPAKDARDWRYYEYYEVESSLGALRPVKKSVKFTDLDFKNIQCVKVEGHYRALYAGTLVEEDQVVWPEEHNKNAMAFILKQAFGGVDYPASRWDSGSGSSHSDNPPTIIPDAISVETLLEETTAYYSLFFASYNYNPTTKKIYPVGSDEEYTSQAVKDAEEAYEAAVEGVNTAKDNFYKNIYCKFWGIDPEYNYDKTNHKLNTADSLKIRYTEKTFTDPYVIPVFTAIEASNPIFIPAKSKVPAVFVWDNLAYNEDDAELKLIEEQLKPGTSVETWNNFKNGAGYTLYAQALAAEQIAALVEDYKENTKALAELEEVVAEVEVAYAAALLKVAAAEVVADSVVTAYLGEDIVKKAIAAKDAKTARGIWNSPNWQNYIVNVKATDKIKDFTATFCEGGKYKLGGQQLAAAEANIPDYAKAVAEHSAAMEFINEAQTNCTQLARILNEYVQEIAKLDKNFHWGDAENIDAVVRAKWAWVLESIQGMIKEELEEIAENEAYIKKLEAGYDNTQIAIEKAMRDLAKAEAALEAAETRLAAATAAYQQVLDNHDME